MEEENKELGNKKQNVCIMTYDYSQHLRLYKWLNERKIPIKCSTILYKNIHYSALDVIMSDSFLCDIEMDNVIKSLFVDILVNRNIATDNIIKGIKKPPNKGIVSKVFPFGDVENLKDFISKFHNQSPPATEPADFLDQTNEVSLSLFKRNDKFIEDYVKTPEMDENDKVSDIEYMIEYFLKDERYEDCALLQSVKNRVIDHYEDLAIKDLLS